MSVVVVCRRVPGQGDPRGVWRRLAYGGAAAVAGRGLVPMRNWADAPDRRPVFAKPPAGHNSPTEFYVRVGNSTKALHGNNMLVYQANHWAADGQRCQRAGARSMVSSRPSATAAFCRVVSVALVPPASRRATAAWLVDIRTASSR